MATLEELVVTLVAETQGLKAELAGAAKATQAATDKMDDAIKSFSDNSSKNVGFFESAMATMTGFLGSQAVLGVFGAVKDAAAFLGAQLVDGAESAIKQEKALTQLANSLALSGQYSKEAQASLQAFTDKMEAQTGIADDVVASNLAVLSSITRLNAEGLQAAQKAAIDLSAAMGMDLESATRLVAKGVEGNVEAFKRYGITVEEGANKSENLKNILAALSNTQGAAAGAMQTFDGALTSVKNSFGNYFEAVATSVTQNQAFTGALKAVDDIFKEYTSGVNDNSTALKELVGGALVTAINGLAGFVTAIDVVIRYNEALVETVKASFNGVGAIVTGVMSTLGLVSEETFQKFVDDGETAGKKVGEAFSGDTALGNIATDLLRVGQAAEEGLSKVGENAEGVIAPTVAAGKAVRELTEAEKTRNENLKSFSTSLADQNTALDAGYKAQQDTLKNNLDMQLAMLGEHDAARYTLQEEFFAARQEQLIAQQDTELAQLEEARNNKLISEQQYQDAKSALETKQRSESMKLALEKQKADRDMDKQKLADLQSTFSTIATLSQSGNKTLASIGKAAAITNATIDGYAAVQKALASAPPPYNFALAALVGAATAANVAKISGVGLASGIDSVPGIGTQDNFPAVLAPGERVVPSETNKDLTNFLENGGQGGGNVVIELRLQDQMIEFIEAKILERQRIGVSLLQGAV